MTVYCIGVAAVLFAPWWPLQIACAIPTGLFIATFFIVGHDARQRQQPHTLTIP
jgi:fatty acid desaturase